MVHAVPLGTDTGPREPEDELRADVVQVARAFAEQVVRPAENALDRLADPADVFTSDRYRDVLRQAWTLGFHKLLLPTAVGGIGLDRVSAMGVHEELCRGGVGFGNAIGIACVAALHALASGRRELVRRFTEPFCEDRDAEHIGALAVVEPRRGSDVFDGELEDAQLDTRACREGDAYVIRGSKADFVSNGGLADAFVVTACVRPELGMRGNAVFLVPGDVSGLSRGKPLDKLGLRCLNQAAVFLDDARVPCEFLLANGEGGGPGARAFGMEAFLCYGNTFVGTTAVGIMRAAYEEALGYAQERVQGGKAIVGHQHVALKLFDAYTTIHASRALLRLAARESQRRFPGDLRLAIAARCHACNEAVRVTSNMIQVLGGYGISRDYPLEKHLRDAKLTQIEDGAVDTLALLAARRLDTDCAAPTPAA